MNVRFKLSSFLRRHMSTAALIPPIVHGYIDNLTLTEVSGWMWDPYDPAKRLEFEVAIEAPEETRVIASGTADQLYPSLLDAAGDAKYGFHVAFATPLTARQRNHLVVRPTHIQTPIQRGHKFEGFVDERSNSHVAGWVRNRFDTEERLPFDVLLIAPDGGERLLASSQADLLNPALAQQCIGDGQYGFRVVFNTKLSDPERDAVIVRPAGAATPLPLSPYLVTAFEPIDHIAIDIVNNCNLRCPFCLFDYSETRTTRTMSNATFSGLLPLLPYVRDGNFWLSCLHEPTLNPDFLGFIERVPAQWRRKVMFTTNLAKRMPDAYFESLAGSGISHVNISLESRDPAIFERMRKGARWNIFLENWDRLTAAWKNAPAPPRLRYIIMAYRSNRDEIPELVKYLRAERLPWQVEVRHTYNALHIPRDFRTSEFLKNADWAWLGDQLGGYAVNEVMLIAPPELGMDAEPEVDDALPTITVEPAEPAAAAPVDVAASERRLTQPFNLQIEWDGKLVVYGKWNNPPELKKFAVTNINDLAAPYEFLMSL